MYVQSRPEVRTVEALYIENPTFNIVSFKRPGFNLGITTQAERIKIVALANGRVSVKGLGKGGFKAVHLSMNSRVMMEGERSVSLYDFILAYAWVPGGLNFAVRLP